MTPLKEELEKVLTAGMNLVRVVRKRIGPCTLTPPQVIVRALLDRAVTAFEAACLLCEKGYYTEAMSLTRSLFEIALHVELISADPEVWAASFIAAGETDTRKFLDGLKRTQPQNPAIPAFEKLLGDMARETKPEVRTGPGWPMRVAEEVEKVVKHTGREHSREFHGGWYHLMAKSDHCTPMCLQLGMKARDGVVAFWPQSWDNIVQDALVVSTFYLVPIVVRASTLLGLDMASQVKEAIETIRAAAGLEGQNM